MRSAAISSSFTVATPSASLGLVLKAGQILSARVLSISGAGHANLLIGQWRFVARLETVLPGSSQIYLQIKEISADKVVFRLLQEERSAPSQTKVFESAQSPIKGLAQIFHQLINPLAPREEIVKALHELFSTPLVKLLDTSEPDSAVKLGKAMQVLNNHSESEDTSGFSIFIPILLQDHTHEVYLTIHRDNKSENNPAPLCFFCSIDTTNLGEISVEAILVDKTIDCFLHASPAARPIIQGQLPQLHKCLGSIGLSPRHLAVTESRQHGSKPARPPRFSVDFRL